MMAARKGVKIFAMASDNLWGTLLISDAMVIMIMFVYYVLDTSHRVGVVGWYSTR